MRRWMFLADLRRTRTFRFAAAATLTGFAFLTGQGCTAIRVKQVEVQPPGERPAICMRLYLEKPDADKVAEVLNGVETSLEFQQPDGSFAPVASSRMGTWTLKNAPAGVYRIGIGKTVEVNGKTERISGDRDATFRLGPDKGVDIQVVLKQTPVGLIVAISVAVVVVAALVLVVAALAKDDNLHLPAIKPPRLPVPVVAPPPLPRAVPVPTIVLSAPVIPVPHHPHRRGPQPAPPPPPNAAPPPVFIEGAVYVPIAHAATQVPEPAQSAPQVAPPDVTQFFPPQGSQGVPTNTTVAVWFSSAVSIVPEAPGDEPVLTLNGSASGPLAGRIAYDPGQNALTLYPSAPLAPGEAAKAKLSGRRIRDDRGRTLPCDYEWSFTVEPSPQPKPGPQ